jgi:glycosyltransferase involved in cell wall biosynthesis
MKIFGVGISKTGTSSLAAALTHLGFPCVHGWPPADIEKAAALVDVNAACRYRELDVMYPGSKFILTTRERETWLPSCQRHWEVSNFAKARADVRFEFMWCRAALFGRLDFDPENHWRSYLRHVNGVREYFANRPDDLLEIDIPGGDGWEPLCRFLNVPAPDSPFPWKNRTPSASGKSPRQPGSMRPSAPTNVLEETRPQAVTTSRPSKLADAPRIPSDANAPTKGAMKVFVLGVPHTQTTREFNTCPFTTKAWNQCRMLHQRGHHVVHLGVEGSDPPCSENVAVASYDEWSSLYGHPGAKFYNIKNDGAYRPYHERWARAVREAILARTTRPWEAIVACTWGGTQIEATKDLKQFVVETGIGYRHTWAKYRVFVSYAWMHFHYGRQGKQDGSGWYDVVIPNAVDPELFDFRPAEKMDDFLFMGRLNDDKGVGIAIDAAKRVGRKLTLVGQGDPSRFLKGNPHVKYLPPVDVAGRRQLMSRAAAVFCPTHYVEPLGNVALEAQISGTPVICTDWGGFTETVLHGVTGFRCRTMEQFCWAAKNIQRIRPDACRQWVLDNYSLHRVGGMLEEYFRMLYDLDADGWYAERSDRTELDWLTRRTPVFA